ncbi:glycosyltransferase [Podospora australis]|uniref:Glycosyltransferase n=1 Tax=Podospora australis TaxID=1536484 RepID=A0AAN6X8X0_9PEZI|nr:glycosyltransferase [Podospora australis]
MSSKLAALCAVTSFLWLSNSLEDHQIIEQPRLSSSLILFIAGLCSYAVSYFSEWLPGANGRFDDELGALKVSRSNLPRKPPRYFTLILVACIILRLEAFHRVTRDLQCSQPGLEAFLPLLVFIHEAQPWRRQQVVDDPDDISTTTTEAIGRWLRDSTQIIIIGVLLLTRGAYVASTQDPRSTIYCSSHDRSTLVLLVQWVGVCLDAAIIIIFWRILAWARTTKLRLTALSGILLASAFGTGILYWGSSVASQSNQYYRGIDALYVFDVVVDGFTLSVFLISTSLLAPEGTVLSFVGVITFITSLSLVMGEVFFFNTWENISPWTTYFSLLTLCIGISFFVFGTNTRTVVFIHRAIVVLLLLVLVIAATIYTPIKTHKVMDTHSLTRIIYDARVGADRWLRHASASDSLRVAVQEYGERHHGRDPPAKFDVWYKFAKDHKSPIIDHFAQMEKDLLPFWGIAPSKLREDTRRAAVEPDFAMLKIQKGTAMHNLPPASPFKDVMDDMVDMINKNFASHLPDMELAINMDDSPRVLAPFDHVQSLAAAGKQKRHSRLLPRSFEFPEEMPEAQLAESDRLRAQLNATPAATLRDMTALTCPLGTKMRAGVHWDIRDFCASCARPQSKGQFLFNVPLSQDICHQSDLLRQHSFYMNPSEIRPWREVIPVFSRAKTDSYADILLPLRRITAPLPDLNQNFGTKAKKLFWRGQADRLWSTNDLLRGGHQERLVHTTNTNMSSERVRALLPSWRYHNVFEYQEVRTADLNRLLPFDVGFSHYTACTPGTGHDCNSVRHDFSPREDGEALRNQYVMVIDADNGPPRDVLRVLRSSSVPFVASVFKEWYTERLLPWVHFVPIDLRFHALHSTLAFFVGIQKKDGMKLNGRELEMRGRPQDAEWIADQGKRWAEKAMRREDMQVYLFRLLLEWGRLVDDKRDEIGFVLSL